MVLRQQQTRITPRRRLSRKSFWQICRQALESVALGVQRFQPFGQIFRKDPKAVDVDKGAKIDRRLSLLLPARVRHRINSHRSSRAPSQLPRGLLIRLRAVQDPHPYIDVATQERGLCAPSCPVASSIPSGRSRCRCAQSVGIKQTRKRRAISRDRVRHDGLQS